MAGELKIHQPIRRRKRVWRTTERKLTPGAPIPLLLAVYLYANATDPNGSAKIMQ